VSHSSTTTQPAATASSNWLLPLLAALFFCSGASALIYQVVWLRQLGLVFGVTVFAASTVWASFMSGLALGSLVAGRVADRVRRPLLWFAAAELLIGVSALLTPAGLSLMQQWYVGVSADMPHNVPLLTLTRVVMTLAVLFVPTLLMGATLPLVVKSSLASAAQLGPRLGLLYGTNTTGAIAGTLAAGLFLIPRYGMSRALVIAASLNLLVAFAALVMGLVAQPAGASATVAEPWPGSSPPSDDLPPRIRRLVLVVFTLSGFASLALEVTWFRVIVLLIRPTAYGFSMMLATLLFGIAAGSYIAAHLLKRPKRWLALLAALEIAMAIVALLSVQMLVLHPRLLPMAEGWLSLVMPSYHVFAVVASVLTILPTALLMGVSFPIGLRLWAGAGAGVSPQVARRVGTFYALNVTGSIVGSLAAGFLLLPLLGSRWTLVLVCGIILASGLALLSRSELRRAGRWAAGAAAALVFSAGAWRMEDPFELFLRLRYPTQQVLWSEEGVQATVSVQRMGQHLVMNLEGNHQASDLPGSVNVHRAIGHLPMALHPGAREALVIGLGGGATAGAVSMHGGVEVDVVELSQSVVTAARYFNHINEGVLTRRNVQLRVDDGRNHLLATRRRYDVITADLILPIYSGAGNLYSAEYFTLVRNALKERGLALQWVWGTDAEYKTIMRTFLSVFPHATLWRGGSLMIGSREPLVLRQADFDWKMAVPGRRAALLELGYDTFDKLTDDYVAGAAEMRAFVGSGPILTDDRPLTEYFLALPRDRELDLTGLRGDVTPLIRR
jgi:spermidine synthase